jgi:arsenite-transporting ATPase
MPHPRILLFTGKGGVGKTTCAAASALRAAEGGKRVLILSSDPAHSLADALGRKLGPEPEVVARPAGGGVLEAMEVDLYYSMQKYWSNMRSLMKTVLRWQGVEQVAAEELAGLPGMNEGSVLLWLDLFVHETGTHGAYDLIVVDSAPTGETLNLLSLPQATQWWLSKAFPLQKTAVRTLGFAVRATTGIPLDKSYDELDSLFGKLQRIQKVMTDPQVCSIRLVMNPERMVIQEARRAYTYLRLYGYGVDAAVINRILPEEGAGPAWEKYLTAQAGYLREIDRTFSPLPVLRVGHLGEEVFGLPLLSAVGASLYAPGMGRAVRDPSAVFFDEPTFELSADGPDAYVLRLRMPLAEEFGEEVRASHQGEEVAIQLGGQRRIVSLPGFLAYYRLTSTQLQSGWLSLRFVA